MEVWLLKHNKNSELQDISDPSSTNKNKQTKRLKDFSIKLTHINVKTKSLKLY